METISILIGDSLSQVSNMTREEPTSPTEFRQIVRPGNKLCSRLRSSRLSCYLLGKCTNQCKKPTDCMDNPDSKQPMGHIPSLCKTWPTEVGIKKKRGRAYGVSSRYPPKAGIPPRGVGLPILSVKVDTRLELLSYDSSRMCSL